MPVSIAANASADLKSAAAINARAGLALIEQRALSERRNLKVSLGSRKGRIETMRNIHLSLGPNALGYAHDDDCRIGELAYLSTMLSASLYKGIGVVSAVADLDAAKTAISLQERLEVLIDIHVLKRLALRVDAADLDRQMAICAPVISWCAAANQLGIRGRFVVPTKEGIFFCRRDPLPDLAGIDVHGPVARVVTFYSLAELNSVQTRCWIGLRDSGVMNEPPAFPAIAKAGFEVIRHLCSMSGADLVMRSETVKTAE